MRKPTPEERIAILTMSGIPKEQWGVIQNLRIEDDGTIVAEIHENALTPECREMQRKLKKWANSQLPE